MWKHYRFTFPIVITLTFLLVYSILCQGFVLGEAEEYPCDQERLRIEFPVSEDYN